MIVNRRLYLLIAAATLSVYAVMVLWSLPKISAAAGGIMPFDMRPGGYSFAEAQSFLATLDPEATAFYLSTQLRLDLLYPALLMLTLVFGGYRLGLAGWRRGLAHFIAAFAVAGAAFDYLENAAIAGMLNAGATGVLPQEVALASQWTMLKSGATSVAGIGLLVLLAVWIIAKRRT